MARIPQQTIDQIRDSADIVDVVSRHVDLKKRGRNFFGLCPFHSEKTPSFSVAPDKGIYHCFGCGNGGNSVNFIMELEKISFVEAIQQLGQQLGIEVAFSGNDDSKQFFDHLYEIHRIAADLYKRVLASNQGNKAKQYLLKRGITKDSITQFSIGYAPANSKFLARRIKDQGFDREVLEKSGLFGFSNSDIYDRFRGRIMFPIFSQSGKVIAFGGRVFGTDDPAKYMNSPETPLYHKSEVFYGLDLTRDYIRKSESAILVEGYTDLIQLYQGGIKNTVAVSGTAFTSRHVQQIQRFASKVYLAYDGDTAGINAAKRAGYALLKGGVNPKVIRIPDGLDPDDWIGRDGADVFRSTGIEEAIDLLPFHLQTANFSKLSPQAKSNLIKDILSEASEISDPIVRQDLFKNLAQFGGIEENQIMQMFTKQIQNKSRKFVEKSEKYTEAAFTTVNSKAELAIIKILASDDKEARSLIKSDLELDMVKNEQLKKLADLLIKGDGMKPAEIIAHFESIEDRELVSKILIDEDDSTSLLHMAKDCLDTLSKVDKKEKIKQMRIKIREMEATGQDATALMIEVVRMQKDLRG